MAINNSGSSRSLRAAWSERSPELLPLPPLDRGIRASAIWRWPSDPSGITGPKAFPFRSVRRMIDSFTWWRSGSPPPCGYPNNTSVPQGPDFAWDREVQGIAYDADYMYLVSTDALWAARRDGGAPIKNIPESERSKILNDDDGTHHVGRRHLRKEDGHLDRDTGPKHLSAPSLYRGFLLVPAEGGLLPAEGGFLSYRQQLLWVFDTDTLGYRGSIGLNADKSNLNDQISWCSADEESGLLYASRYNPKFVDVFRLPSLSGLSRFPAPGLAVDVEPVGYKPLDAPYVGSIPITDFDGNDPRLNVVNGGLVTPSGHLYLSFMEAKGGACFGMFGLDLLTGKAVRYISLECVQEGSTFPVCPTTGTTASPLWLVDALGDAFGAVTHWAELPVEALIALGKEGAAIAGDAAAGLWRLAGGTRYTNAQVVQGITLSDGDLRVLVWDPDMPVEILGIGTGSLNHPEYSVLKYVLNDHTEVW